jgi:hypothetical protein
MVVAVVASAAYLKGKGYGREIDSADLVVRVNMNSQIVHFHPDDIGTKTDVVYVAKGLWRHLIDKKDYPDFKVPEGAVMKLRDNKIGLERKKRGYYPNTGMIAVEEFAKKGHIVKVFGMDFYSSAFGGKIPRRSTSSRPIVITTDKKLIYLEGYTDSIGEKTPKRRVSHIGGDHDVKNLIHLMKSYPVYLDPHMETIIANYKRR